MSACDGLPERPRGEPPITHPSRALVVLLACALALGLALWVTR